MWNRSILIARTWIVWIFWIKLCIWIKLSGSNYLDQIIWIKLSGSNYLDQIIWIKLSRFNSLDQIIWFRLFGSNYFEYYESFWIIFMSIYLNSSKLFIYTVLFTHHCRRQNFYSSILLYLENCLESIYMKQKTINKVLSSAPVCE